MAPEGGAVSRRHRAEREGEPPQGVDGTRRAEARNQAANEGAVFAHRKVLAASLLRGTDGRAEARPTPQVGPV